MAAQYMGSELDVTRRLAEIAVDLAKEDVNAKKVALDQKRGERDLGTLPSPFLVSAQTEYNKALLAQEKAQLELKRLDFAIDRHQKINELVQSYMQLEEKVCDIKRERLKVLAPAGGHISLRVALNSFAELGSVLLVIK